MPAPTLRGTLAAAVVVNLAGGTLFAWSILLAPLAASLEVGTAELSGVFSGALAVFATVVLAAGRLTDRRSPRVLAAVSGLASGAGLLVAASSSGLLGVGAGYGLLFGLGSGLGYVTAVNVASTRFSERRGLALGLVVGAYAAGPVAVGPLGPWVVSTWGWRAALVAQAVAVAGSILAVARWLPAAPVVASSEAADAAVQGDRARPRETSALWALWSLFLMATAPALLAFAVTTQIAVEGGVPSAAAGTAVSAIALGNLTGRLLAGPVSDRLGSTPSLWLTVSALIASVAVLGWVPTAPAVLAGLVLLGLEYGAVSALLPVVTGEIVPPRQFGWAYGRVFSSWGVAGLLAPALGGWLHDMSGDYELALRLSLLPALAAAAALLVLSRARAASRCGDE